MHVAKVMACTAVDVLQDDVLLARAKADHQARVRRTPYVARCRTNWIRRSKCPRQIGAGARPPSLFRQGEHLRGRIDADDETIPSPSQRRRQHKIERSL